MIKKIYFSVTLLLISFALVCSESDQKLKNSKEEKYTISEVLIYEVKSKYSHIKVRDYGTLRQLYFIRDNGEAALESTIDTNFPQNLFLLYTQTMFASFLVNEVHSETLLIGLGGGGMVHFLNYYFPNVKIDAVEIDPAIVEIAQKFFKLKNHPSTRIFTEDAFQFISKSSKKYDVIYMDAFLKPNEETDSTGVAKKFKAPDFFQMLKSRLKKNGIVVFNLNSHEQLSEDIVKIQKEFETVYFFQKSKAGNLIVIGSTNPEKISHDKMLEIAAGIDKRNRVNFSFSEIAKFHKEKAE